MMPKIRRFIRLNRALVTHLALLCIGILGLLTALVPSVGKSITLLRDLGVIRQDIASIQKKESMLALLDQTMLEKAARDVLAAVPADKSVSTLLSTVDAVATKNGLVITDLSVEGIGALASGSARAATAQEGNILTEKLTLQGELVQLRNFLSDAVRVRRLMRIKNLVLTSVPKSTQMSANLVVEVFYLPLPTSIGKATDLLEPLNPKETATLEKISSYPIAYAGGSEVTAEPTTPVPGEEPTSPAVADPFSPPRSLLPTPSPTPTPRPTLTPTPSLTPKATPSITPTSTPTPTP